MGMPKAGRLCVDVRSDHVQHLPALVPVLLIPVRSAPKSVRGLNPVLVLRGEEYPLTTQLIASVPRKGVGRPVGTLEPFWDDILRALDFLFTGF